MAISDMLRGCPLFFELHDKEVEKIVKRCSVVTYEKEQHIIQDGSEGDEIYILLDGAAMVRKTSGKRTIDIQPITQGDVFGEMVLVDQRVRSADIVATKLSHVLEIRYGEIFQVYKKEPKIFGLMMLNLCRLLAQRLRASNQIIMSFQKNSENR